MSLNNFSLVANWAWSRWGDGWLSQFTATSDALALEQRRSRMTGVCTGFAEGSSARVYLDSRTD
ncbi:hypothetical protein [Pseudomonas sp. PDM31]|uniref:hypothetical protein n=1 Tax=Pseudomonas sp. PDM31 TaxID=2854778 RepID=UPI001C487D49|nr:hypothetical protein [Pseudomonas sp. PDM31]MBV7477615.1 hypothetical protein [Pseudomonas sp. PDM31]